MDRAEFLKTLYAGLSSLPDGERRKWRDFYAEMIDDRMEEGLSEQQAVAETGDPAAVIEQIYAETPLPVIIKQKIKPKRSLRAWEIVLICLGAPVWAPLIIAVFAVIFSIYISLWAIVISFYAAAAAVGLSGVVCFFGAFYIAAARGLPAGALVGGAGLLLAGISVFAFIGCNCLARLLVKLISKAVVPAVKKMFIRKGGQNEER